MFRSKFIYQHNAALVTPLLFQAIFTIVGAPSGASRTRGGPEQAPKCSVCF